MVAVAIFRFEAEAAVFAAGSGDAAVFVNAAAARAQGLGEARAEGSEVKDVRRALVVDATVLAGERRFQFLQFVAVQILAGKAQRLQLRGVCRQAGGGFGAAGNMQDAIVAEKRRQLPARGEAFPGGKAFPVEREQGAVVVLVARGQHVGEHLPAPGQHFRQVTPVDA